MKRCSNKSFCKVMFTVFLCLLSVVVVYFAATVFSRCLLMDQVTPWLKYNSLECEELPLEIWFRPDKALVHKFPLVTYVKFTVSYLDDGKTGYEDICSYIESIALKGDEIFKGNKTEVIMSCKETKYGNMIFVELRRRCVSPIKFLS